MSRKRKQNGQWHYFSLEIFGREGGERKNRWKKRKKNGAACSIDMCMKEKKIAKIVHENPICKEVHVSCEEQVDKSPLLINSEENANGNVYLASTCVISFYYYQYSIK